MIQAFVNFVKRGTENFAHNVNLPVGVVRIALAALVLTVFFKLSVAVGFVVGVVYAIYAHNAISLRSVLDDTLRRRSAHRCDLRRVYDRRTSRSDITQD